MTDSTLQILTWNANGLRQRTQEIETLLKIKYIDIALISEAHITHKDQLKILGFKTYWTSHPSGRARAGTAILVKANINHHELEDRYDYWQSTIISVKLRDYNLTVAACYCPFSTKLQKPSTSMSSRN